METNRACDCKRSGENASERATRVDPYGGAARLIHGRTVAWPNGSLGVAISVIVNGARDRPLKFAMSYVEIKSERGKSDDLRVASAAQPAARAMG
jgi:hypothetical protein